MEEKKIGDSNIGKRGNQDIIKGNVAQIVSAEYDNVTPVPSTGREEYCHCADDTYITVSRYSTASCAQVCCNGGESQYYDCSKIIKKSIKDLRNDKIVAGNSVRGAEVRGVVRKSGEGVLKYHVRYRI